MQRVLGNGTLQTNYTYYPCTAANRQGRSQNISTGSLQNMSYTYDAVGNVLSVQSGHVASRFPGPAVRAGPDNTRRM